MKDLRISIPVITAESVGQQAPDGILFPNLARLDIDSKPQALTGILKLVQQVYLEILTETQPNGVGSNLAAKLRDTNIETIPIVARAGVADLLVRLLRYQDGRKLPADERIFDLQIRDLQIDESSNTFTLSLLLTSEAGETVEIKPPLV